MIPSMISLLWFFSRLNLTTKTICFIFLSPFLLSFLSVKLRNYQKSFCSFSYFPFFSMRATPSIFVVYSFMRYFSLVSSLNHVSRFLSLTHIPSIAKRMQWYIHDVDFPYYFKQMLRKANVIVARKSDNNGGRYLISLIFFMYFKRL